MDAIAAQLKMFSSNNIPALAPRARVEGGCSGGRARPEAFKQLWRLLFKPPHAYHGLHNLSGFSAAKTPRGIRATT